MSALDLLKGNGTAVGLGGALGRKSDPTIDPGMSIPLDEEVSPPKAGGLDGGFISVPGPKGSKSVLDTASSEQILKRMQDYLDQRTGPKAQFESHLADALAYGSGPNPSAAVYNRQQQKESQANDILAKQMEIAQFRSAQEQQKIEQANYDKLYGSGAQAANGTTMGSGYGGTTPGVSQDILRRVAMLRASGYKEEANKLLNESLAQVNKAQSELAYSPTQTEIVDVWVNGEKQQMTRGDAAKYVRGVAPDAVVQPAGSPPPPQAQAQAQAQAQPQAQRAGFDANVSKVFTREGGYKPADSNGAPVNFGINQKANPDIDVKNLSQDQAKSIYKARYWDPIGGDQLPPATAAVAFDAAVNQGVSYAKQLIEKTGGDPQKMLAQRMQDYTELAKRDPSKAPLLNGWLNRLQDVRANLEPGQVATQAAPTQTQTQNAPVIQAPIVGGTGKGSGEVQQALTQKAGEANIEVAKSGETAEQQKIRAGAGDREAKLKDAADPTALADLRNSSNEIINAASNHPEVFAIGNQADWKGMLNAAMPKIPILGGKTQDVMARSELNPETNTIRTNADSAAARLQAYWAKVAFQGSRMEQAFLRLAERAKGVSVDMPAKTNIINATLLKNTADFVEAKNNAWERYKQTHDNPRYENFEESPELKQVVDVASKRLKSQFPDVFSEPSLDLKTRFPKKAQGQGNG